MDGDGQGKDARVARGAAQSLAADDREDPERASARRGREEHCWTGHATSCQAEDTVADGEGRSGCPLPLPEGASFHFSLPHARGFGWGERGCLPPAVISEATF